MARIPLPDGDGPEALRALALRPQLAEAVQSMELAVAKSTIHTAAAIRPRTRPTMPRMTATLA